VGGCIPFSFVARQSVTACICARKGTHPKAGRNAREDVNNLIVRLEPPNT
jgi:hypothetical protein